MDNEIRKHIQMCFDDAGNALHTIPREFEDGTKIYYYADDGYGGFQYWFEEEGDYVMDGE